MAAARGQKRESATGGLAIGAAAFAVFCCAVIPLVVTFVGGLTAAGVLGVTAGVLIAVACTAVVVVRIRRRRTCRSPAARTSNSTPDAKP